MGVLVENGCLLCERHPIQIIQKTLQLHITQKIMPQEVVDHQPSPHSEHKVIGVPIYIRGPQGLGGNHLLRLPNKGGVAPKGKRITPCPEIMLGVVTPYQARSHSLVGQRGCMGSLFSGSSVQTRRVLWVRGWGNHPSDFPFPLPVQILTFWTLIMRGLWAFSFPLPAPTSTTSSTSPSTSSSSS